MSNLRSLVLFFLLALVLGGCGGDQPQDATARSTADTARTEPAAQAAPAEQEKPWMVGLRWKGPADQRLALDITYHLGEQLGTQKQTNRPRVQAGWSYLVGSPWVKGMVVEGAMDTGEGPVEVEIIRVRTVGESPIIEGDDDVEVAEVLGSMTVAAGGAATMQGGELLP